MGHFTPRENLGPFIAYENYPADLKSIHYNLRKEDEGSQI